MSVIFSAAAADLRPSRRRSSSKSKSRGALGRGLLRVIQMEILRRDLLGLTCSVSPGPVIDGVQVLRPTRHNAGHFGDVLPGQYLGV